MEDTLFVLHTDEVGPEYLNSREEILDKVTQTMSAQELSDYLAIKHPLYTTELLKCLHYWKDKGRL